jgi:DNA-binding CsgD family transcriptional regulator
MTTTFSSNASINSAPTTLRPPGTAGLGGRSLGGQVRRLLDGVPIPAVLIGADRAIVMRNLAAEIVPNLLACVSLSYGHVMRFAGAATEPFDRVFGRALDGAAASAVVTLRSSGRPALWRVNLGRISHSDASADAAVLMLIYPPAAAGGTLIALQRLFDLTAAEARVLALLLDDCRPREIAGELGISITTVRSHLQALFAKTGTRRQSELVALAWSAA